MKLMVLFLFIAVAGCHIIKGKIKHKHSCVFVKKFISIFFFFFANYIDSHLADIFGDIENGLADTTDNETNDDDDSEATAPTQPPQQTPDPNAGGEGADEGNVATTPPDPEKEKETPEKQDEEGNKDGEPAGTTPAPVKGAPPQYNINLVPVQESGSGVSIFSFIS